jgi:hypothetical protein
MKRKCVRRREQATTNENEQAHSREHERLFKLQSTGQAVFFEAFSFAHRVRWAAAILLRALAVRVRFLGIVTTVPLSFPDFTLAHRALWAAAMLALPAADILPRGAAHFP